VCPGLDLHRFPLTGSPECHFLQAYLSDCLARFGPPPDHIPPKQPFWDSSLVASDRAQVQSFLDSPLQLASFLAATARHSGDWLFVLPIASCGLKLDDETVRVAVGLRFGLDLCPAPMPMWLATRQSTLLVCTAFSANRPLVDGPGITC